jgi:hypothetical protein
MVKIIKTLFILFMFFTIITCSTQKVNVQSLEDVPIIEFSIPEGSGRFFFYIPEEIEFAEYLLLHNLLRDWDRNQIIIDNEILPILFENNLGKNTMNGLLFESFLRYTKNEDIQKRVLEYIEANNIDTGFTDNLKKLYAAIPVVTSEGDKDIVRYVYNNSEFDENINLFRFNLMGVFNDEVRLFLFENDWHLMARHETNNESIFIIMYGGNTNAISLIFRKHSNINENEIDSKLRINYFNDKYNGNWMVNELPLVSILTGPGTDRYIVAHGYGPEEIPSIESATFITYLYNRKNRALYEINYYMNISPENINYPERSRIFNLLFFQTLLMVIANS